MWLYFLFGALIGVIACFIGLGPKLRKTEQEDKRIIQENELQAKELSKTQEALRCVRDELDNTRSTLAAEKTTVANLHAQVQSEIQEVDKLRQEKDNLNETINFMNEKAREVKDNIQVSLDNDLEKIRADYEEAWLAAEQEYGNNMRTLSEEMGYLIAGKQTDLDAINTQINQAKQIMSAINEERERAEADSSLYMLSITVDDLTEINALREVAKTFRDATPVNKLIWTLYYQKPYKNLVLALLGDRKVCGIYAITDTIVDKKYIGQSVDVATRWSDHIKRGLGADKGPDTKLYTAMKQDGVEKFKFELLEEVPRDKLNERERFWIEYFNTTKIGLNTTKGNS